MVAGCHKIADKRNEDVMASGHRDRISIWSRQGTGSNLNQVIKLAYLLSLTFPDVFLVVFPYMIKPSISWG